MIPDMTASITAPQTCNNPIPRHNASSTEIKCPNNRMSLYSNHVHIVVHARSTHTNDNDVHPSLLLGLRLRLKISHRVLRLFSV